MQERGDNQQRLGARLPFGPAFSALVLVVIAGSPAFAKLPIDWSNFATTHCIVNYQDKKDLDIFDTRIKLDPVMLKRMEILSVEGREKGKSMLARKLDFIFERVQALLDMRINMGKVNIYVYKDYIQIEFQFKKFSPRAKKVPRSWYIFQYRSVYVNLEDINTNILAHEIAHHVIDNYYMVPPDAASSEILAVFVEKNFFE